MVFVEVRKLSASTIDYVGNLVELDEFRILRGFSIADEQAIIDFACHLLFRSVMGRGWGGRWEVIFLGRSGRSCFVSVACMMKKKNRKNLGGSII